VNEWLEYQRMKEKEFHQADFFFKKRNEKRRKNQAANSKERDKGYKGLKNNVLPSPREKFK
jgi:hypothetical protein